MVKIYLDPGHGGNDPGAVSNGLKEKDLTLSIALKMRSLLAEYDVSVKMSRSSDKTVSLATRTNDANNWEADYFVSIHVNAGGGTGYEDYIHTSLSDSSATAKRAKIMHEEIMKRMSWRDRGQKQKNFHVLRETKMSAILTENGFIDNKDDAKKLKDEAYLLKIAQGHVAGIVRIFGLAKKQTSANDRLYKVQVGAFANKANAERLAKELGKQGYDTYIVR